MREKQIEQIIKHFSEIFDIEFYPQKQFSDYEAYNFEEFIQVLKKKSEDLGLLLIETQVSEQQLKDILSDNDFPIIYFIKENDNFYPVIDGRDFKHKGDYTYIYRERAVQSVEQSPKPYMVDDKLTILTVFPLESISKEAKEEKPLHLTPLQRLLSMLKAERKDIISIYIYAMLIGVIGLVLPLSTQAIIGLVQGGLVFSSIYLLIGLFILALIISGVMQIMQMTLVEYLIERLFAKAAFEYTFRIPKIKAEALLKYYPPELMNRFFDIITVQKSLPKLLIDVTAASIQIIFGLILLTAYHPLFIAFTIATVMMVYLIIKIYAPRTLDANITKSKYKYKIAQWLQDIARTLYAFKVAGNSVLPMQKMERHVSGYLKYRKKYFNYLLVMFYNAIFFKIFITGGLLILGTFLVIDRQITIGQFVASEIVIVLVVSSVEKIILSFDSIFDLLVAVDKLGYVSDLPLDKESGLVKHLKLADKGLNLKISDLKYRFEDSSKNVIDNLSFTIKANERICITGSNGSGKETLLNILAGILVNFDGQIAYNNISLRDIDLPHLHDAVERNITADGIFDGTIYENISLSRNKVGLPQIYETLEKLRLSEAIGKLKEGLNTQMISSGRRFSTSFSTKICLARCIVSKPKLLLISNCYEHLDSTDKQNLIQFLCDKSNQWTLITVSNDPMIVKEVDRVMVMDKGKIIMDDHYTNLSNNQDFQRYMNQI
jgi:ABC-type bacteriocin/lantibiotic exporter with double-glycine peptidase domain